MSPCVTWQHGMGRSGILTTHAEEGERANPEIISLGELLLALISCSSPESGPYILPGPHSKADPDGLGVGEWTLRT